MLMQAIAFRGSVMAKIVLSVCVSTLALLPLMDRPHSWSGHRRLSLSIYSDRVADVSIMSQGRDFGNSANLETTGMRIARK